jgi:cobalamin biosynthesis Mg chelatase CobN
LGFNFKNTPPQPEGKFTPADLRPETKARAESEYLEWLRKNVGDGAADEYQKKLHDQQQRDFFVEAFAELSTEQMKQALSVVVKNLDPKIEAWRERLGYGHAASDESVAPPPKKKQKLSSGSSSSSGSNSGSSSGSGSSSSSSSGSGSDSGEQPPTKKLKSSHKKGGIPDGLIPALKRLVKKHRNCSSKDKLKREINKDADFSSFTLKAIEGWITENCTNGEDGWLANDEVGPHDGEAE